MQNTTDPNKKYFYVKVIEAREVVQKGLYYTTEPFVTVKKNGHEFKHKKTTSYAVGKEWWDVVFKFSTKHIDRDWIAVEVREKGWHVVSSDWIGEVQVRVRDFADGKVHQKWFKLGLGAWKHHTRRPRGYVQLAFQLKNTPFEHPFGTDPVEPVLSFAEWIDMRPKGDPYKHKAAELVAKTIEDKDQEGKDDEERRRKRREKKKLQQERKKSTPQVGKKLEGDVKDTPKKIPAKDAKDAKAPLTNQQVENLLNLIDWESPRTRKPSSPRARSSPRSKTKSYNPFLNSPSPVARTLPPSGLGTSSSTSSAPSYPELFNVEAKKSELSRSAPAQSGPEVTNPFTKASSFDQLHGVQEYNPFRLASETN
eukprot:TRINITY_DN620_c0_g1_i1.p1 TRINITY_DN620_c0_g1~~TRINITY_DN620_c0_g1_i1.p1  ORF type:complete len:366 (+),score=61.04 TRINITY_DN620_c0_g1_i1:69-1166(+)